MTFWGGSGSWIRILLFSSLTLFGRWLKSCEAQAALWGAGKPLLWIELNFLPKLLRIQTTKTLAELVPLAWLNKSESGPGLWLPLGEEAEPAAVPGGLSSEEPTRKPTLVSRPCGSWTMIFRYIDEGVVGLVWGFSWQKILPQNSKVAS